MCWVCNPLCGGCRPPRKKAVVCPGCGTFTLFDIEIEEIPSSKCCRQCGVDLVALATPEAAWCVSTQQVCGNPCGRRSEALQGGEPRDCQLRTSPTVKLHNLVSKH